MDRIDGIDGMEYFKIYHNIYIRMREGIYGKFKKKT